MTPLTILVVLYALFVVGVLSWGGWIGLRFRGTLTEHPLPEQPPSVSTIVPARNEERNIGRNAAGLVAQDYPNLEMVFVDDDSEDTTGAILARFAEGDDRVKVINTGGKPTDWNGKQWACWSGAQTASGDWYCFMDADTFAEPHLISRTVAFSEAVGIDMFTLQPWYEMRGLWERIVLPAGLIPLLMVFPPDRVNDPDDHMSIANGQFILIRRTVYEAIDGHRAVKTRMMDDFSLAQVVKDNGHRLFIAEGLDVMRVRLYENFREIRSGALKAAVEITGGWRMTLIGLFLNFLMSTLPPFLLLWAILAGNGLVSLVLGMTVLSQLIYYGVVRIIAFRIPPWTAITYPLGSLLINYIVLDGMFHVASGRDIKWKNRDVMGRPEVKLTSTEDS